MKTTQEILSENGILYIGGTNMVDVVRLVMKTYAEEALKEAALVCREHSDSGCFDGEGAEANILNIINELK